MKASLEHSPVPSAQASVIESVHAILRRTPESQHDLLTPNDKAFVITHTSRWINPSTLPEGFSVIYLGLQDVMGAIVPSVPPGSQLSFIFDPAQVEVKRRVYRYESAEEIRMKKRSLFDKGFMLIPCSIPDPKEDPYSIGIVEKVVAFRFIKPQAVSR